jgi:hypothetical protein
MKCDGVPLKEKGRRLPPLKEDLMKKSFSPEYIGRVESQLHTTWVVRALHVFEICAGDARRLTY